MKRYVSINYFSNILRLHCSNTLVSTNTSYFSIIVLLTHIINYLSPYSQLICLLVNTFLAASAFLSTL